MKVILLSMQASTLSNMKALVSGDILRGCVVGFGSGNEMRMRN